MAHRLTSSQRWKLACEPYSRNGAPIYCERKPQTSLFAARAGIRPWASRLNIVPIAARSMALGIIFIGLAPGYAPDLFSYLFGNILTVPASDLLLMLILDVAIIGIVIAFYKEFLALSLDEEYSTVIGVPVEALYLLLLGMIALTVVILLRIVGMILVIALLTIPAALARQFTYNLGKMMMLAIIFGIIFTFGGLWISYALDLASGATIVLLGGAALLVSFGVKKIRRLRAPESNTG